MHLGHLSGLLIYREQTTWMMLLARILLLNQITLNASSRRSLGVILRAKIKLVVLYVPGDRCLIQMLNMG